MDVREKTEGLNYEAEYIDREVFKKSVEEYYCKPCKADGKDPNGCRCRACWVDDMLDEIDCFQPAADVVEVVRCKDCKYCDISLVLPTGRLMYTCMDGTHDHQTLLEPNDFCSYGERKEGDD